MDTSERDKAIYLDRLAGKDVAEIARERGLSRPMVHRIIRRYRDSGAIRAVVGTKSLSVSGPFTADEIGTALRTYASTLGIQQ